MRLIYGLIGLAAALYAVSATVGFIRGIGDRELDAGLIAFMLSVPCLLAAVSLYFLRLAFKRPNR